MLLNTHSRPLGLMLLSVCSAVYATAQGSLLVQGTVVDGTGAAIPSAIVRVETAAVSGRAREIHVDGRGNFSVGGLAAGEYMLTVPAVTGFAETRLPLHLFASMLGLKVAVPVASLAQTISVGDGAGLSTDAAANKDTVVVTGESLRNLPVFDQDYLGALTPFLDPSSTGSGGVTIIVDGIERKNVGVSPSAIQEVRINNDPYSAEFRSPGRGRMEIITKPGAPEFHGELNFLFRDATLNARNYFAVTKPPEQRRIFEGNVTGPVGRGRNTTFLVSGAHREEDLAVAVHAVGPGGVIDANVQTPNRTDELEGRVSHDFSTKHRVSVQYNFEYDTEVNQGVGGLSLPEAGSNDWSREDDLAFTDRYIVNPHLISQFQVTFEKDEEVARSVTDAPSVGVLGAFIGGGAQADLSRTENTMHLNEIVSLTKGKHYVRFGANIPQLSKRAADDHTNRLGTYNFGSLAAYNAGTPDQFTIQQGVGRALYWMNELGGFVQDQVTVTPKLQVTAGVRYDWQTYLSDRNNFSPRLSAAYAPGKGKTIFRTGVGAFYDRTGGDFPVTVKLHNGVVLQESRILKPVYPVPSGSTFVPAPTDLVRFAAGIRTPYSFQYSGGVERALRKKLTMTMGYRGFVQAKSFRSRDANAPLLGAVPNAQGVYPRPDPRFGRIQQIESGGRKVFNGLDVAVRGEAGRGEAGRWFVGQAQYTLSKLENNAVSLNWFPQDQYRPNDEWGRGNTDQRHRFNLLGNINPGHWLTLGVAAALSSGMPYNETVGADRYNTGLENARPVGVARNTLQASGVIGLDLSWGHDFHLDHVQGEGGKVVSAQIAGFNVLNHANLLGYVGNLDSPLFGQATSAGAARQMQFQVGYRF